MQIFLCNTVMLTEQVRTFRILIKLKPLWKPTMFLFLFNYYRSWKPHVTYRVYERRSTDFAAHDQRATCMCRHILNPCPPNESGTKTPCSTTNKIWTQTTLWLWASLCRSSTLLTKVVTTSQTPAETYNIHTYAWKAQEKEQKGFVLRVYCWSSLVSKQCESAEHMSSQCLFAIGAFFVVVKGAFCCAVYYLTKWERNKLLCVLVMKVQYLLVHIWVCTYIRYTYVCNNGFHKCVWLK